MFTVATMTWLTITLYLCHILQICSVCRNHNLVLSSFVTYHQVCDKSSVTGTTCGARTAYPLRAPEFTPAFSGVCVARSLVFCVVFRRSLFVLFRFPSVLSVFLL